MFYKAISLIKSTVSNSVKPKTWLTAFKGIVAMETFFRLAPHVRLTRIDNATLNGTILFPPGKKASAAGTIMFYSGAVGFVSLFKSLKIKGSVPIKGIKFATAPFLLSSLVTMPMMGLVNQQVRRGRVKKPGFFGLKLGGWKGPVSNLCGHLIFGLVISRADKRNK